VISIEINDTPSLPNYISFDFFNSKFDRSSYKKRNKVKFKYILKNINKVNDNKKYNISYIFFE
jgi:hypothetical protein